MELRSRILAEIETGDSSPGVPGPPPQEVEGSGAPVPDSAISHRSITEEAGASLSHPSTAGLMGAIPWGPRSLAPSRCPERRALYNPDVHADIDLAMEAGIEVRPTQPSPPSLNVDVPSGYPEDSENYGTPDTLDIEDILSINVSPLSVISTSGIDATNMSVSVGPGISMSVDFDDRDREITAAAMLELADSTPTSVGARPVPGNPSISTSKTSTPYFIVSF